MRNHYAKGRLWCLWYTYVIWLRKVPIQQGNQIQHCYSETATSFLYNSMKTTTQSLNFYSTVGKHGLPAKTFDKVDLSKNT